MKKLKCIKCGLYFKDRKDPTDSATGKETCFKCNFILRALWVTMQVLANQQNREITFDIDGITIRKK